MTVPIKNTPSFSESLFLSLTPDAILRNLDGEVTSFTETTTKYNERLTRYLQNRDDGQTPLACVALRTRISLQGKHLVEKIEVEKNYAQGQSTINPNSTALPWHSTAIHCLHSLVSHGIALPPPSVTTKFDNLIAVVQASQQAYETLAKQATTTLQEKYTNLNRAVLEQTIPDLSWPDEITPVQRNSQSSFPQNDAPPKTARTDQQTHLPVPTLGLGFNGAIATAPPPSAISRTTPSLFNPPTTERKTRHPPMSQQFIPSQDTVPRRSKSI